MVTDKMSANPGPALKLNFISHGTLGCKDVKSTKKFYQEFFGFDVVQTSPISLLLRLGGNHAYAVVKGDCKEAMSFLGHNGVDVFSEEEVDRSHEIALAQAEKWGLTKISKPRIQHGTYGFYFWDMDGNCWEILSNPGDGYSWLFDLGDQDGTGHMDRDFVRPDSTRS